MSGLPINDLAKAIADATGWVQHIAKLTAAEGGSANVEPK